MSTDRGARAAAAWGLGLLACMFALPWYGVDGIASTGGRVVWTENAWDALGLVRWVMLLTVLTALGAVALRWRQRGHGTLTSIGGWVASLGLLTVVLLVYRVLIDLPDASRVPDQKLGSLLGLAAAIGLALGGWDSLRHERMRGRRASSRSREPREASAGAQSREAGAGAARQERAGQARITL